MAGIWFVITILEAGSASGERDNTLCRGFSQILYIIIQCKGHEVCNKIRVTGHMQKRSAFVVPFFLMHTSERGCAVTL